MPIGVRPLNQIALPRARPFLKSLFATNGSFNILCSLEINEMMDAVAFRESRDSIATMLIDAPNEVVCNADI